MKCLCHFAVRSYLLALLFLLLCPAAHAQRVSELTWRTAEGRIMHGLLVFTNEEKAYLRVTFNEYFEQRIAHVNYVINVGRQWEDNYYWMDAREPRWITRDPGYPYKPDYFVWLWRDPSTDFGLPYTSKVPSELGAVSSLRVLSYQDVNPKTVDDYFLNQFYLPTEPEYKAMRQLLALDDEPADSAHAGKPKVCTMHLVIAANTAITDIGGSCETDKRNLINEMAGVCDATQMRLKRYLVEGENFSKEKLTQALTDLKPEPNDVVVFVYRGHGFRWSDQQEKYPQLDLRANSFAKISNNTSMGLQEVCDLIGQKGARLNLFFADCCNSDVGISMVTPTNFLAMQTNDLNYSDQKLARLFLKAKGSLVSAAASPGESSWANNANGGFFTVSLIQSLHEEVSFMGEGDAAWEDLLQNTIKGAKYKSSRHMCSNCTEQNGIHDIKVTYGE